MATTLTPSHPQFVFVFAAVRRADRKPRICMLRTVAGDEHAARLSLVRDYVLSSAGCGGTRMRHTTITARDLECLEHMRNVGELVNELMQVQDCATVRRDPAQQSQLTSVIYLMTAQLDGVVERCNQRWLTGEGNV